MAGKTFSPVEMDSTQQKWILLTWEKWQQGKTTKSWVWKVKSLEGWRLALQGHPGMEGQQVVFRKNRFKRRKLWETEKESAVRNGWHNRSSGTQGAKGGESMVSWTLKWHYKRGRQPTLKGDSVIGNQNKNRWENSVKNLKKAENNT